MTDPIATLILTRPRAGCEAFLAQLDASILDRANVIISPLLEIVSTAASLELAGINGVIFTSMNGLNAAGAGRDLPAYCVGTATTSRASELGWDARNCGGSAQELVEGLSENLPKPPLLHISGTHTRGDIAARLTALGCETKNVALYDQKLRSLTKQAVDALEREKHVIVPLFSPRTARQFATQATVGGPVHLITMSDAVMAETKLLPAASRHVASSANVRAMSDSLMNLLRWVEAGGAPQ